MKNIIVAAAFAVISSATVVSASPSSFNSINPDILVNKPVVAEMDELACMGCISPNTGRIRDGYVAPHIRSNGAFVNGYWRS